MNKTTNEQKRARGTNQPCRMDKEPVSVEPLTEMPKTPTWANNHGKKFFRSHGQNLLARGILNELNIEMYALLACEFGTYIEAQQALKKEGRVRKIYFTDDNGKEHFVKAVINPYQKIADNAFKNIKTMGVEFGLTPTSIARIVAVAQGQTNDNPFDNF